jgi:hypothetical protein
MRAAWRFVRPAVGTPTVGFGSSMHRPGAPSLPVWLPAPLPELPVPLPRAPAPWIRPKGLQIAPSPEAAPSCRRKRGDAGCTVLTDRFFRTPLVGPRRPAPRSARGPLVGPRRPAPRPRSRRGASVLRLHNHRVHRHHNHHNHRVRRHHHLPGAISPRGTTSSSNNSSSNSNSGCPVSRVVGRSRAQVSVALYYFP